MPIHAGDAAPSAQTNPTTFQHADSVVSSGRPSRSAIAAARISYAEAGIFTSLANARGKKPVLSGWQEKATRNPSRITAEANSDKPVYSEADGVLAPTGRKYGRFILDDDGGLEELEEHLELSLRGITWEITTPSGNRQLHFCWPKDGEELRGSVGKHVRDGHPDVDVRGEGHLGLLPPSPGYGLGNDLPTAQAPPELVEWARGRTRKPERPAKASGKAQSKTGHTEVVERGSRHVSLMSTAGRLHDGTRGLAQLTAELHEVNASYLPPIGSPGDDDPLHDVDNIARWIYSLEPCSPSRPKELVELVAILSAQWYGVERRGLAQKNEMRLLRHLTAKGYEVGEVVEDGLMISESIRQAALAIGCHPDTVTNIRNRLVKQGLVRYDKGECGTKTAHGRCPGAFVLLGPRQHSDTYTNLLSLHEEKNSEGGVGTASRPGLEELRTRHYRQHGPVGVSREDTLVMAEAHQGSTAAGLARLLGWSRVRDLQARHLRPLQELGLLERDEESRYWIPECYEERQEDVMDFPYSTVRPRAVRTFDSTAGRWVSRVVETGCVASQNERDAGDRAFYEAERHHFARSLTGRSEVLEHDSSAGAECVLYGGELVNAETGEVLGEPGEQGGWASDEEADEVSGPGVASNRHTDGGAAVAARGDSKSPAQPCWEDLRVPPAPVGRALGALCEPGGRSAQSLRAYLGAAGGSVAELDHVASAVCLQLGEPPVSWREWIEPVERAVELMSGGNLWPQEEPHEEVSDVQHRERHPVP